MNRPLTASGQSARRTRDAHRQTGELLFRLGITPHTPGYEMLRDGARLLAETDRGCCPTVTTELYPLVGEQYRRDDYGAEHAMRGAIRLAWQREDADRQALYFDDETPTNTAFLYTLAGCIRVMRERSL